MTNLSALVVDDSKVGRLTMQKRLEAIGIQVDMAESGQQALEFLAHHRPDLIFMDHMMPDMDGFEVTRRIKATPGMRDIPVVIASGNDEPTFVEQARAAGAIDAITKPPPPGVLEALLAPFARPAAVAAPTATAVFEPPSAPAPPPTQPPAAVPPPVSPAPVSPHAPAAVVASAKPPEPLEHLPASLRDELLNELLSRLDALSAAQRQTIETWERGWRQRLEAMDVEIAAVRRALPDVERLDDRVAGIAHGIERRLALLEEGSAHESTDADALRSALERSFAAAIAESRVELDQRMALDRQEHEAVQAKVDARLRELTERIDTDLAEVRAGLGSASAVGVADAARSMQSELATLRERVKILTLGLAIGGGALLIAVAVALFRG